MMDCNLHCKEWCSKKNLKSCNPKEINGLHATSEEYAEGIIKSGFQHSKGHEERVSFGKGSAEEDIFFFERDNPIGMKFINSWKHKFESERKNPHVILKAKVCSCNYLNKNELIRNNDEIVSKSVDFIMKAQGYSEKERKWAFDHLGGRLKYNKNSEYGFNDPFSFLRKVANDSDHCIYEIINGKERCKEVIRYNIGEVMDYLGYDTADGYTGSHMFDPRYRDVPINEFIVHDSSKIYDIQKMDL